MNAAKENEQDTAANIPEVRIIKIENCKSLSGKSTLTYHVGLAEKCGVMFRVWSNTGGGYHSRSWLPISMLQNSIPADRSISAQQALGDVFSGTGSNNISFYFAVVLAEGLVTPAEGIENRYMRVDPSEFMQHIQQLIDEGTSLQAPENPKKAAAAKPEATHKKSSKRKGAVHQ
jgi:hypothetical protein